MQVQVKYFAAAREATGLEGETLELDEAASVDDAFEAICARHRGVGPLATSLRFAVGETFVAPERLLRAGETLILIPPVGGG